MLFNNFFNMNLNSRFTVSLIASILITLLLALFAIDSQSLWIDEFGTWKLCNIDTFFDWYEQFIHWQNSDTQIPLYHLYMYLWAQFVPLTEVGLRASNLPWLFVGVFAVLSVLNQQRSLLISTALMLGLHGMLWYYVNEARPYLVIFAGAALCFSWLIYLVMWQSATIKPKSLALWRMTAGLFILSSTSLLGIIWSIPFVVIASKLLWRDRLIFIKHIRCWDIVWVLIALILLIPVFLHYGITVIQGIGATPLHENKISNFGYGFYELFSLAGLGPGRDELRTLGVSQLANYLLALLCGGFATSILILLGFKAALRYKPKLVLWTAISFLLPVLIIFVLGEVKHWRVVGRHLLPLMLPITFIFGLGLNVLYNAIRNARGIRKASLTVLMILILSTFASSAYNIAFAYRHTRENYQAASQIAINALRDNKAVWWVADQIGADYYGLAHHQFHKCDGCTGQLRILRSPDATVLDLLHTPDVIILSRPDTHDRGGAIKEYIFTHHFNLSGQMIGFEIWQSR